MSGVAIRTYADTDRAAVNAVALAAFAQYADDYDDWPSFGTGIGRMADLAAVGDLLVAEREGAVIGAIVHVGPGRPRSAIFPGDWSVIRMLVVDPAARGAGVGRALVAATLERAARAGAPAVGLHTSPIMATALRLYEGIGFRREHDLPPIRGVPYARYMLPAGAIDAALARLAT
ncbi:GNAT family N-acetyltransferase [Massilia pinisoli]|uniref:GNAT family N-acetyltransferase n=1 Tax=Massilia pinisoli TaxID=1772194 RepID=A0ABT1ZSC5_9BURK|nr:GNAT family N-acetyltransferase [Massilia pinisoli]MCS0582840.1 GNAT family N-acetyltransferase [Massilia pinisoli]